MLNKLSALPLGADKSGKLESGMTNNSNLHGRYYTNQEVDRNASPRQRRPNSRSDSPAKKLVGLVRGRPPTEASVRQSNPETMVIYNSFHAEPNTIFENPNPKPLQGRVIKTFN